MLTLLRGEYAVLADLMARQPPFGGEGHAARLEMHQAREARLSELNAEIQRIAALEGDALVREFPPSWS
jgi:hypothetical protein